MINIIDIQEIGNIAKKAGSRINEIYNSNNFSSVVDFKADNSPLTDADRESHKIIVKELRLISKEFPILSEEGKDIPYNKRKKWEYYWLIDPLDGTKEFIKRNGEFTVNIALIHKNISVLGVIYVPAFDTIYYGQIGEGAVKRKGGEPEQPIFTSRKKDDLIAVMSRSHTTTEGKEFLKMFSIKDTISVGSSLKFCMIAEGKADIYYRHGPTMEWDTAAGQALVQSSGGRVLQGHKPLEYNKESLLNDSFLCVGY